MSIEQTTAAAAQAGLSHAQTQDSAPAMLPPAGWYTNPTGPGQRYWDGAQWTDSYSKDGSSTASQSMTQVSLVLALASLLLLPPFLGTAAIVCAAVGIGRNEKNAPLMLVGAVVAMIAGMALGVASVQS